MKLLKKKSFVITIFVVLILVGMLTACVVRAYGTGKLPGGITVGGVDVSGLTIEEASQKLRDSLSEANFEKTIHVVLGDLEKTAVPVEFLASYDYEKSAEQAANYFKNGNFFQRIGRAFVSYFSKQEVGVAIYYDELAYEDILNTIVADVSDKVEEPTWEIQEDKLVVTTGRPGLLPDKAAVSAAILDAIRMGRYDEKIVFKKENREPTPLSADTLYGWVCAEPSDSYYVIENGEVIIHDHVLGVSFDKDEAQRIIDSHKGNGVTMEIPLTIRKPETTRDDIEAQLFSDILGEHTTRFNTGDVARSKNIALATNKINGTILAPDEVFSYNDVVGERSYSEGFETASVYVNGETVPGIGGGICQVSSTLFNAVVYANLEIVERVNHQLTVSYVPLGQDATVDYGNIDFRFRNTTGHPIKIVCSADGGRMHMAIYGYKEDKSLQVEFETETISVTEPPVKKVEDPTLPLDEEKVESAGSNGYVVDTYKIVTRDGHDPERIYLCRSSYSGSMRVVHVGTGENVPPEEGTDPENSENPDENTSSEGTETPSPSTPSPTPSSSTPAPPSVTPSRTETSEPPEATPDSDTVSDSGL